MRLRLSLLIATITLVLSSCLAGFTAPAVLEATPFTELSPDGQGFMSVTISEDSVLASATLNGMTDAVQWLFVGVEPFSINGQDAVVKDDTFYQLVVRGDTEVLAIGVPLVIDLQFSFTDSTTEYYINFPACLDVGSCRLEPPN